MSLSQSRSSPSYPRPRLVVAIVLFCAGCATTEPALFATASELPTKHRHPDGVALDLASAPPPTRERAASDEGLCTLRTPLGVDVAVGTVALLFQRILREDTDGLDQVFTRDAVAVLAQGATMGGGMSQTPSYSLWWGNRFHKLDYTKLAGETIYRESELEVYRSEDLKTAAAPSSLRIDGMGETDVVIRVPIATARIGQDRLFGDELVLWLRREGETYKIYRSLEDFQLQ
jgi:hypothetical protein